jgi:hypothetical protein
MLLAGVDLEEVERRWHESASKRDGGAETNECTNLNEAGHPA